MKKLFHYTNIQSLISILKNECFRFSDLSLTNDFLEMEYVWNEYLSSNPPYKFNPLDYFHKLDNANHKYFCFSMTENANNPYMYGIYNADVCIELNNDYIEKYIKLIENNCKILSNSNNNIRLDFCDVQYLDTFELNKSFSAIDKNMDVSSKFNELYKLSLQTKTKEWQYEKEARLVLSREFDRYFPCNLSNDELKYDCNANDKDIIKSFYDCKFDKRIIKSIIVGPRCSASIDEIEKMLLSLGYDLSCIEVTSYDKYNFRYYKLRTDCYYRNYKEYGYLLFVGYFKDVICDSNANLFLKHLSYDPIDSYEIASRVFQELKETNNNIDYNEILSDEIEFFDSLVKEGFLVTSSNIKDIDNDNIGFNYLLLDSNKTYQNIEDETHTQNLLDNYFLEKYHLMSFQIELTSKCNERCVHCYIPHELKNTDIKDELYFSVLDQLQKMNTLSITLSGGEPMSHPHFKNYLKTAKEKGFYVHILSNLTLLDDEIINLMREGNAAAVQVSLYSMIPEHHDSITCLKGSFDKTKDGILKLIKNNIPLQINCPVMKENKSDVYDVIKWGQEHKVRVNVDYSIMAQYNHETGNLEHRLSSNECRGVIKNIIDADDNYKDLINGNKIKEFENYNIEPNKPFCGVGFNTCCMVSNGNIYPCPGWQGMVLGNLNEQSLQDIWENSDQLNKLRKLRRKDMPKCLECENRAFCSPCLSRFANESKTGYPLEVAEHFCEVAKVNKDVVLEYIKKNRKEK